MKEQVVLYQRRIEIYQRLIDTLTELMQPNRPKDSKAINKINAIHKDLILYLNHI